jgi:2-succinyl-5-enolpyruvyl-6-hydroxy-3-cyclohexene-1-carboxylate synthase
VTPNQLAEWSRLLFGTLARAGIRDVIISPGSRSTPFAWAALKEASLRCHSIWDERVAGFFALGQARVSGRPSVLLCTSGSAPAHYFPALVEASQAHVPVLVLSADRPLELMHASAPQAIDQLKLFGEVCRGFFELGVPSSEPSALRGLVRQLSHACLLASYPVAGPVHLNARAQKPLEPVAATDAASLALSAEVNRLLERGPVSLSTPEAHTDVTRLVDACARAERGLIVVGPRSVSEPAAATAFAALAVASGFPVLCESPSQLRSRATFGDHERRIDGFDWLLRAPIFSEKNQPDLIVSFGPPPTSGGYERLLARGWGGRRIVVSRFAFPDPHGLAHELTLGDLSRIAQATADGLRAAAKTAQLAAQRETWLATWRTASELALRAVEDELSRPGALSEPQAVREITDALPDNVLLAVGNSLPIREIEAYGRGRRGATRVLCQRGANGIDGLVAGAAGSASVTGDPVLLLLGDVSFLHDLGGLAAARAAKAPLVIVVLDNGGGRIFEQLPVASLLDTEPRAADYWLTPPHADLGQAAGVFGHAYRRVSERAEIRGAIANALATSGTTVLHVVVEPSSARAADERVLTQLAQLLREAAP